ncbi:zinc metallopeptidase [Rubinisphaera sp. JC750]|uniref:zinc metallopeptidase n=1 Tax=Rubinisphaera sp. JC750 TaxID=2898658 RepID=UPI001F1AB0D7|nr:zinc metallopeptidase [Rubinisphaera sp. JC750]
MGYLIFVLPAIILMMWAQHRVKSTFARGMQVPARMSGAATARHILDTNGLSHVDVVETAGMLSDHYDPSHRVVRLSHDVYHGRTASSVGIAAHEVGHALQHANHYAPLVIRNAAVPAAQFGGTAFTALLIAGFLFNSLQLVLLGAILYGGVVIFQLVNLPVEFDASNRAKRMLPEMGIVDAEGSAAVRSVLNAAAWTYVAATLQSILTIAYYLLIFTSRRD